MRTVVHTLMVTLLLIASVVSPVSADNQKTIFYNVTSDEAWRAGMALGQANKALESGYSVVISLNVRGVFLASKSFSTDSFSGSGASLQDMLKAAMKKGGKFIICPMCMKKAGMSMDDVIDGVVKGGPDSTLKAMTADDTTVVSY